MSMDPQTHHVTAEEIEAAIAEAIKLAKADAQAGIEPRGPDEMPTGLEIAWDKYCDAHELELRAIKGGV